MERLLYLLILLPVLFGIIIYLAPKRLRAVIGISCQVTQLALSVYSFLLIRNAPLTISLGGWNPPVGIMLVGDRISGSLVLLTSLLFLCFLIFNTHRHYVNRVFYMLYLSLQGLLSGIFLADDLFSIFVLVEVSTMIVSLLIMFKRDSRSMYDGLIYLLINTFSMTLFLFGLALLYRALGTFSLTLIRERIGDVSNIRALYLPYALMMTSVCLKAAIMPLFSWLPKAHGTPSAPSIVSAVLSGLYVKGGIYLFIRLKSAFYVIDSSVFFFVCGAVTAVVGFIFAISQRDIKLILSYSTVSQLGLILLSLNMQSDMALWAGVYHIISHAVFKSVLFLCAGVIAETYATRDVYQISGVFKRMPVVSFACIFAMFGITGAPLFNGSISKYLMGHESTSLWMEILLLLINLGTLLAFSKFFRIFKQAENEPAPAHVPLNRRAVLIFLSVLCLLGGIFGGAVMQFLFGIDIHINGEEYLIKGIIYIASLLIALIIYITGVMQSRTFSRIRALDLGFNEIALTLPAFFCVLLGYLLIFQI